MKRKPRPIMSHAIAPKGSESRKLIWREVLRNMVGDSAEKAWTAVVNIAEGNAWVPKLPDGREGPPQVPTAGDRLAAARYITEMLHGKAVVQTDIVAAEVASADQADLSLLTEEQLRAEVARIMANKGVTIVEGKIEMLPSNTERTQENVRNSSEEDDEQR